MIEQTLTATSVANSVKQDAVKTQTSIEMIRQPDFYLRPTTTPTYVGSGIYNMIGVDQTVGKTVANKAKTIYLVVLKNKGNMPDTYTVTGPVAPAGWTVVYRTYADRADITAAVTGAGWTSPELNANGTVMLQVDVTPSSIVTGESVATQLLTATSNSDAAKQDVALINTTVAALHQVNASIRPSSTTTYTGTNIINTTAVDQTIAQTVAPGVKASYVVKVVNTGNMVEAFTLTGPSAPAEWTVSYLDGSSEITTAITDPAGWTTPVLNPGDAITVQIDVTPDAGITTSGAMITTALTATTPGGAQDVVAAQTTVQIVLQPDLYLRPSSVSTSTGANIFNLTGVGQTVGKSVAVKTSAMYIITVKNKGNVPDSFTFTGPSAPAGWTVVYRNFATNEVITTDVTGAGWTTPVLGLNGTAVISVQVTPGSGIASGTVETQTITVTSTTDTSKQDVGVINTTVL